jgi:cytochrome c-type biogenesis protein CcmH/NrfF
MVIFEATINGDPIYQGKPLIASFGLFVGNPPLGISFDRAVLLYGLPIAIIVPIGLAIYDRYRKKSTN